MQRPARPKSAKGKTRPTPPSYPRSQALASSSGRSIRYQPRGQPTSNRLRQSTGLASDHPPNNQPPQEKRVQNKKSETEQEDEQAASDPSQFPDVSRPVSSLSRYSILPRIPPTPNGGDRRSRSPAESELELDLMSSFAQQMILDSTTMNRSLQNSTEIKTPLAPKRAVVNNVTKHQNESRNNGSPEHKKFRSSSTKSVFTSRNARHQPVNPAEKAKLATNKEPKEGEPRLKLALKLPDGRRVERYFSTGSTVHDVMHFAQSKMRIPIRNCNVYSMLQVPKVLIRNWKQSLQQLEIPDRTMLYIEEKD